MKRIGIAGFQLSDVNAGGGQTVTNQILFGSPEWLDAVRFSASEAERLGLEMSIFSSAGWSLAGGPWVKPEEAMKKLVWSELNIIGGTKFTGKLPQPPACYWSNKKFINSRECTRYFTRIVQSLHSLLRK